MGELFYLDFKNDSSGEVQIDEPIGYADMDFNLQQKDKGYGRDISFSGGEAQFNFVNYRNHYLDKLLYFNHFYGFESKVDLIIRQDGYNDVIAELDFASAVSDDFEYFKCKVIQQSSLQIVKRRKSVKVDLFSDKDVDGNPITPLTTQNMLLLNKPVYQKSKWEQSEQYDLNLETKGLRIYTINPAVNITKYDIDGTQNPFEISGAGFESMQYLESTNNLKKVTVKLNGAGGFLQPDADSGGEGSIKFSLEVRYGSDFNTSSGPVLLAKELNARDSPDYTFNSADYTVVIDSLNRGDKIWICYQFIMNETSNNVIYPFGKIECFGYLNMVSIDITAESSSYNSITPSFRLIDVMRQVVKSTSGLDIIAPRFDVGGAFYDNRLFNGNFLRNALLNTDGTRKPFYISLEDIEKSIVEMNADHEIDSDGKLFFGTEEDFYTSYESGFFDNTQFSEMTKVFNPRFSVNEFSYKYKNYQALKENEETNSADNIHGESKYVFTNKMVENKKEITVEWIRDAFLIESNRRKAIAISKDTASQDDDTLFCIDASVTTEDKSFTETSFLQHFFEDLADRLTLRSDGEVNFNSLGISVGSVFVIESPDINAGTYTVQANAKSQGSTVDDIVASSSLLLMRVSAGVISSANNGERVTKYTYTLDDALIPFINYTNEGFSSISNLNAPDNYSNLRYSIRRNINNYYQPYLATCNLYHKDDTIKNTWYKNNGECITAYNGITLKENESFIPSNPILSPFMYDNIIFANVEFTDFISLQNSIRSDRGYIRTIDNNNRVIKVYPITMKYEILSKELTIKAEEKYEPKTMTISTANNFILINNETYVQAIDWELVDNKLFLYDKRRQLLYNGVFFNNVAINDSLTEDVYEFESRMNLL
jgi:hypothetical protein